jgi:hypothetical protein
MRRYIPLVAGLGLAACTAIAETPPDACGAAARANLIGQPGRLLEEMSSIQGTVRLIPPGAAITEDYSETRLNADLDDQGRIVRLWCG